MNVRSRAFRILVATALAAAMVGGNAVVAHADTKCVVVNNRDWICVDY
jgi:hypothetical protein